MPELPDHPSATRIAVVGAGSIGLGFAVVHARCGHAVTLHDADAGMAPRARERLAAILGDLERHGLLDESVAAVAARVEFRDSLEDALQSAELVHECAPEDLALKRSLFAAMDAAAPPGSVLASASSALTASAIAEHLDGRARCLVAHPGNPPFLIPVVEIVPAPFTDPAIADRAGELLARAGMAPVRLRREVRGFVYNRLQGALLREAYCLVRDGVVDVEDVDRVVREGLGFRWSVVGPFETVDLNTRGGIERHAALLGPAYAAMGAERGQDDPWTPALVARVTAERRRLLPLEDWEARVSWRDRELMRLRAARRRSAD